MANEQRYVAFIAPHDDDPRLAAQVEAVRGWWAPPTLPATELPQTVASADPTSDLALAQLGRELKKVPQRSVVGLYVTGHGKDAERDGEYRLITDDGEFDPITTFDRILESNAGHALIIVDSCHAHLLQDRLRQRYQSKAIEREDEQDRPPEPVIVITGTGKERDPRPRYEEFTTILTRAIEMLRAPKNKTDGEHLTPAKWLDALLSAHHELTEERRRQHPQIKDDPLTPLMVWPPNGGMTFAPSPALPNPALDPDAPPTIGVGPDAQELKYWIDKASGRPDDEDEGWYFTGRKPIMRQVVDWLAEPSVPLAIVTGERGTGKSAVLGRAVTLASTEFTDRYPQVVRRVAADLLPPPGSVDAAVDLRGLDSFRAAELILKRLDQPELAARTDIPLRERLITGITLYRNHKGSTVTVVVDSVDECVRPEAMIGDVIGAMLTGDEPVARVLVGVRDDENGYPQRLAHLVGDEHTKAVRTDEPVEKLRAEVAQYCLALLNQESSPYATRSSEAAEVAQHLANPTHGKPSFSDTRIVAAALSRSKHLVDIAALDTDDILRRQLAAALDTDLERRIDQLAAMVALAYSRGAGVPWGRVWPTMASAVAGHTIGDDVIHDLLNGPLEVFTTTSADDGQRVFRPVHASITELLTALPWGEATTLDAVAALSNLAAWAFPRSDDEPPGGRSTPDGNSVRIQRRIALALSDLVPAEGDGPPDPYLRRHLVAHAAAGEVLTDAVVPQHFLPWETSDPVVVSDNPTAPLRFSGVLEMTVGGVCATVAVGGAIALVTGMVHSGPGRLLLAVATLAAMVPAVRILSGRFWHRGGTFAIGHAGLTIHRHNKELHLAWVEIKRIKVVTTIYRRRVRRLPEMLSGRTKVQARTLIMLVPATPGGFRTPLSSGLLLTVWRLPDESVVSAHIIYSHAVRLRHRLLVDDDHVPEPVVLMDAALTRFAGHRYTGYKAQRRQRPFLW